MDIDHLGFNGLPLRKHRQKWHAQPVQVKLPVWCPGHQAGPAVSTDIYISQQMSEQELRTERKKHSRQDGEEQPDRYWPSMLLEMAVVVADRIPWHRHLQLPELQRDPPAPVTARGPGSLTRRARTLLLAEPWGGRHVTSDRG